MRRSGVPAVCALVALAACGAGEGGAGVEARDSAGVRIVEVAGLPEAPLGWALSAEPVTVIGGDTEDERAQLVRVAGAARRSDGRIVVADGGASEVRLFEADGTPAGAFGRSGGGPGEFGTISFLGLLPGDSVLAFDVRQGRYTVVAPDLTLGRMFSVEGEGAFARSSPEALLAGGPLVAAGGLAFGGDIGTGPVDTRSQLYLLSTTGEVRDSVGVYPQGSSYLRVGDGRIHFVTIPFGPQTSIAASDDQVHVGTAERWEVLTFSREGGLQRILRVAAPERPVTDADVRAYVERTVARLPEERRPGQRRLYEEVPTPERMPAYGALVAEPEGTLWVQRYSPSPDEPLVWTVFDEDGAPLGTVTTPPGVDVRQIGEDWVLGSGLDELDRPYVALWALDRAER